MGGYIGESLADQYILGPLVGKFMRWAGKKVASKGWTFIKQGGKWLLQKAGKEVAKDETKVLVEEFVLRELIRNGIPVPRDHRALKRRMLALGMKAPCVLIKPVVHHELPWKHREWFAARGRGLDVNDPAFGKWMAEEAHVAINRRYEAAWDEWIANHRRASREEVLEFLESLRENFY